MSPAPAEAGKSIRSAVENKPVIITLVTDFGNRDPFVASMKGVILNLNAA